jgi:hypothetical protein
MTQPDESANSVARLLPTARKIELREWWLWGFAVSVTLVLAFAIVP